ncbi:MAG TPA: RNA methyltransferase [Candidatus Kapabacteria bacterium]|jgi:tRNA G18 (ribose-2'-O)-methylase SpoU
MPYRINQQYGPAEIAAFRSLKGNPGLVEQGLFIAESEKIVRKVLASSIEVPIAYLTMEWFRHFESLFDARQDETNIYLAKKEEMESVVGYQLHQGLMLAARIPKSGSAEETMREWRSPWFAIALDGIADAENMGSIIRNAAAFGARAILIDGQSCNPWLRRSVRVSMGTIVDIDILSVDDLGIFLSTMKHKDVNVVGAALTEQSLDIAQLTFVENTIFVFGSEGWGLRKEVAAACDVLAQIPISGTIDSLNVGVASAIFMHAFQSRRAENINTRD